MASKQMRRETLGGEMTFGPKETPETLMFQHLKKQQDIAQMKNELSYQMTNNNKGDQVGRVQQILMDKNNMNIVG